MSRLELDPRFTFENFVVGAANRLAAAAARRVADAPGAAYNPLFLYSASGLGKTHLIMAIGHHAQRVHAQHHVLYETLEHLLEDVMTAIQAGERDAFRNRLRDADVLLLDDVQFLAGRRGAQEELLRAWDGLSARGGQVVLASDRPPTEIDDLDQRLLSRFSGGLIADIGAPEYETRVAIVRRKAEERGQKLAAGSAEALCRVAFSNVRELQGALNRVLAIQELEERSVGPDEIAKLLGVTPERRSGDEFGSFLTEIAGTVGEVVSSISPEQRIADAIMRWEGEGYRTRRLETALAAQPTAAETDSLLAGFADDVEKLVRIAQRIRELDPTARELSRIEVLRNPDRVQDAEALVSEVEDRSRSLPAAPSPIGFDALTTAADVLAMRAARAIVEQPAGRYNPFFVHAGPAERTPLLIALATEAQRAHPELPVGYITGAAFSDELMLAIEHNRMDAWRSRYRRARLLVLDGVDSLTNTERVQEELFHLFDDLQRAGGQLVFGAEKPPGELGGIEDRLRTRLESGLVVDLPVTQEAAAASEAAAQIPATPAVVEEPSTPAPEPLDEWFQSHEKALWSWPYIEDWIEPEAS